MTHAEYTKMLVECTKICPNLASLWITIIIEKEKRYEIFVFPQDAYVSGTRDVVWFFQGTSDYAMVAETDRPILRGFVLLTLWLPLSNYQFLPCKPIDVSFSHNTVLPNGPKTPFRS